MAFTVEFSESTEPLGDVLFFSNELKQSRTWLIKACRHEPRVWCWVGQDGWLLVYISLLGSAASYGVFFFNAAQGNLTALSSLTFLTPVFAAITDYFVLGEVLTPLELAGATVTLGAVYLLNTQSVSKPKAAP